MVSEPDVIPFDRNSNPEAKVRDFCGQKLEMEISGISWLVDGVIHSSNINYSTKALHFDMQERYNIFEYRIVFALW